MTTTMTTTMAKNSSSDSSTDGGKKKGESNDMMDKNNKTVNQQDGKDHSAEAWRDAVNRKKPQQQ